MSLTVRPHDTTYSGMIFSSVSVLFVATSRSRHGLLRLGSAAMAALNIAASSSFAMTSCTRL